MNVFRLPHDLGKLVQSRGKLGKIIADKNPKFHEKNLMASRQCSRWRLEPGFQKPKKPSRGGGMARGASPFLFCPSGGLPP
jgi:hypothetical protein